LKQQLASGGVTASQLAELEKELKICSLAQKELEELRASHRDYTGAANVKFDELRRLKSGLLNTKADFEKGGETWSAAEAFQHIETVVDRVETWASTAVQPPTISSGKRPANSQISEAPSNMGAADGDGLAKGQPKEKKHKRRRKEKAPKQDGHSATAPPEPAPAPAPAPPRNRDTDVAEPAGREVSKPARDRDVGEPPKEAKADVENVARLEHKRREKVHKSKHRDPESSSHVEKVARLEHEVRHEKVHESEHRDLESSSHLEKVPRLELKERREKVHKSEHRDPDRERRRRRDAA